MNTNYNNMKQKELRAACKQAGIKYGKMNVAAMRAALTALEKPKTNGKSKARPGSVIKHGVRQPGEGGKCRAVWDALDGLAEVNKSKKKDIAVTDARALAEANGWNENNTVIEFYQWRKFNGISGRQK